MAQKVVSYHGLQVYKAAFDLYIVSLSSVALMNNAHKYDLGRDINKRVFKIIQLIRKAYFANDAVGRKGRSAILAKALRKVDEAGVQMMAAAEMHAVDLKKLAQFSTKAEMVNRQLAGWKRATENKMNEL